MGAVPWDSNGAGKFQPPSDCAVLMTLWNVFLPCSWWRWCEQTCWATSRIKAPRMRLCAACDTRSWRHTTATSLCRYHTIYHYLREHSLCLLKGTWPDGGLHGVPAAPSSRVYRVSRLCHVWPRAWFNLALFGEVLPRLVAWERSATLCSPGVWQAPPSRSVSRTRWRSHDDKITCRCGPQNASPLLSSAWLWEINFRGTQILGFANWYIYIFKSSGWHSWH